MHHTFFSGPLLARLLCSQRRPSFLLKFSIIIAISTRGVEAAYFRWLPGGAAEVAAFSDTRYPSSVATFFRLSRVVEGPPPFRLNMQ